MAARMRSEPDCTGRCRYGISAGRSRCAAIRLVVHVAGMAGGVAQPRDARHLGDAMQQPAERPGAAVRAFAVIGVDVLADQRDLAHAGIGEPLDLGDDLGDRPRDFGAARIGHDAEGAELVAAFLHGDESRDAARARRLAARRLRGRRTCPRPEIRCRPPLRRARRARADRAGDGSSAARPRDRPPARGG